jgi:hypothetical protein
MTPERHSARKQHLMPQYGVTSRDCHVTIVRRSVSRTVYSESPLNERETSRMQLIIDYADLSPEMKLLIHYGSSFIV